MKKSRWPCVQKDEQGNLVLYPSTLLFSKKGYIIPDEAIRKTFINIHIPIFVLGALSLLHSLDYGFHWFILVYLAWSLILYIVHKRFFREYPVSEREFSWTEHFETLNKERSIKLILTDIVIWLSVGILSTYYFITSEGSTEKLVGIMGMVCSIYLFILTSIVIIHRKNVRR